MKIALIIPNTRSDHAKSFYDYAFYSTFLLSRKYISCLLAIPTISALTPPEHEVRVFDENLQNIDFDWDADLAAISVMTMFAPRAYEISRLYRARGAKTVLGGIHVSMLPQEAQQHCDAVVIGEAEELWQTVLQDVQAGRLKQVYRAAQPTDMTLSPAPDRTGLLPRGYLTDTIQTTKGCPFQCEFCSVHAFDGQRIRSKTVDQVIRELGAINGQGTGYKKKRAVFFADDNIVANRDFAERLFTAMKPLDINWMCQASMNIARQKDLLQLMRESGCGAIFVGFESLSASNLGQMRKTVNRKCDYRDVVDKIQSHGMLVQASFILGYDSDTTATFDELTSFIRDCHLFAPVINILTPFPGTRLFERLDAAGRILHKDWSRYDTRHVVFAPAGMTPDELLDGYRRVVRQVYSFDSILDRLRYYWGIDFWRQPNRVDPVRLRYRLLFAMRLCMLLASPKLERSKFIAGILPRVFDPRVRVSSILAQMAYNDFAASL